MTVVWFMKAAFYTLGCKTNQFETQALERAFLSRGLTLYLSKTKPMFML